MTPLKRSLIICQFVLFAIGILALVYCTLTVAQATLYQDWASRQLRAATVERPASQANNQVTSVHSALQRTGGYPGGRYLSPIAKIEIPRIHISAMVAEGTSARVLGMAVGHVPGTALPGEAGNIALAGHRDTFFRRLGNVTTGDIIKLTTRGGQYAYRVGSTIIVGPDDTWVLDDTTNDTLTLVTCYPFYFVGSAPKRFIVRASRL